MPNSNDNDDEQISILIQRQLARPLKISIHSVTREPLPQRMVMLLLRVAFAQTVRGVLGGGRGKPSKTFGDTGETLGAGKIERRGQS